MDLEQSRRLEVLKIIGILGLISSFGLIGISKSVLLKKRIELLEEYYQMIMELKGQINYFKEPLPNIFHKIAKNNNSHADRFLIELGCDMNEKNSYTSDFWLHKLNSVYGSTTLTKDDLSTMSYLGDFLGQTDYNNHLQHFLYIEGKLQNQITQAKENYNSKSPLYNKIGFFIGGIIGILLI